MARRTTIRCGLEGAFGLAVLAAAHPAVAQTATVDLTTQHQTIRGIGGMSHAAWAGDLTAAERTTAFGNADGQLGFTALRIPVTDGAPDSANVATAQAAIAAGAIVFATPWNAAGAMDSSQFASYAQHLNGFVSYMKSQGVNLFAIGTQNEPDYGSQGGWRTWTAAQCHDFALNYGATIATKLITCESYSYNKSYYDPILNDSAALANVGMLGTHLYGTPVSSYAYPLADSNLGGKERWMTEHYTDSTTDANSWPNALGVATELHHVMVEGEFSLYTWWYIVRAYGPIHSDGTVTKRGWCMAQFSKFVRPGYVRVDATASPAAGVFVSAYKGPNDVVIIAVNTNASAQSLTVSVNDASIASYDRFTTSASKNLNADGAVAASNGTLKISLDAQSVTTLHAQSAGADGGTGSMDAGGALDASASGDGAPKDAAGSAGDDATASDDAGGSGSSGSESASGSTSGSATSHSSHAGTSGSQSSDGASATGSSEGSGDTTGSAPNGCSCDVPGALDGSGLLSLVGIAGLLSTGAMRRRSRGGGADSRGE